MIDTEKEMLFFVNDKKYLKISARCNAPMNELITAHYIDYYWFDGEKEQNIGRGNAGNLIDGLDILLELGIKRKKEFISDQSPVISSNMFYYSTGKYSTKRPWKEPERKVWFDLFSGESNIKGFRYISFLYGEKHGEIIFEVGLEFEWLDDEVASDEELQKEEDVFLDFIDNYKPIIQEIVPRKNAKRWFKLVSLFNKLTLKNVIRKCECGRKGCEKPYHEDGVKRMHLFEKLYVSGIDRNINCLKSEDWIELYWEQGNEKFLIGCLMAFDFVERMEDMLRKAMKSELLFEVEHVLSPAILINKCFIPLVFRTCSWSMDDVGTRYSLFSARKNGRTFDTFLYNDQDNNIIFEVGKRFAWFRGRGGKQREPAKEEQRFLSFIDGYEPVVKEVISHSVVKRILRSVKQLKNSIALNKNGCSCRR